MAISYQIPLIPGTAQSFTVGIDGITYAMTLTWNMAENLWVLDIADEAGKPLVYGISLAAGINLVGQYAYLGLTFILFCGQTSNLLNPPGYADLGVTSFLWAEY